MAFTRFSGFTLDWTTKATVISGQATSFKTWLNTRTADLLTWLTSTFLAEIEQTTDGDSGADNIGMTKLTNYGSAAAATIQAQTEALDAVLYTHINETTKYWKATMTSATQSISSGVSTIISITEEVANGNVSLESNEATILESGVYEIEMKLYCDSVAQGGSNGKFITIWKNDTQIVSNLTMANAFGIPGSDISAKAIASLSANDVITFMASSTPGNTLDSSTGSYFIIRRIS